jgi:hypothetical protein
MIPRTEQERLKAVLREAAEWVSRGQAVQGYQALAEGQRRARVFLDSDEPWAEELLQNWERALEDYRAKHGIHYGG